MGLEEVQRGLATLLTDDALRQRFTADPHSAAQSLNLMPDDAAQLASLACSDVERFARSLRAKRWNEIQKLLPLSCRAAQGLGIGLRGHFLQFAQTYVPQGGKRHAQDALRFAAWFGQYSDQTSVPVAANPAVKHSDALRRELPENGVGENKVSENKVTDADAADGSGAWLADMLRYEAAWLEMNLTRSRHCLVRRFMVSVPDLARTLSAGGQAAVPERLPSQPLVIVWLRHTARGPLRECVMPIPLPLCVRLCIRMRIPLCAANRRLFSHKSAS